MTKSGIGQVETAGVTIRAIDGAIEVIGAAGKAVSIAAVDGTTLFSATATAAVTRVPVTSGLYLVTAGPAKAKLLVK